jgi:hypothetical protein
MDDYQELPAMQVEEMADGDDVLPGIVDASSCLGFHVLAPLVVAAVFVVVALLLLLSL